MAEVGEKSWGLTLVFYFFLGIFGAHRFYLGKVGTAFLFIITLGGFGLWALYDLIMILLNKLDDANGKKLKDYPF